MRNLVFLAALLGVMSCTGVRAKSTKTPPPAIVDVLGLPPNATRAQGKFRSSTREEGLVGRVASVNAALSLSSHVSVGQIRQWMRVWMFTEWNQSWRSGNHRAAA